ncbi:GNAT family N-acetyltransferase [Aliiglaciecola litoralis]|uniref:GNAT family N-acetyltransferase n=1 Tax=Aliiglaciecola litoralis TaxID=582857 RepID=A0ABP3WPA2_9ALTE
MEQQFTVRHSEKVDISAIRQIYQQTPNYTNTLQLPYPSLDSWESFLGNKPDNFYSLVAQQNGAIVGQLGMEVFKAPRRKHEANIGMAVSQQWQGKGVGSTLVKAALDLAHNWLAISRIELEVYTDNDAAISLYQKFGFTIEGTAKNYAFRDGKYVDVFLMARVTPLTAD